MFQSSDPHGPPWLILGGIAAAFLALLFAATVGPTAWDMLTGVRTMTGEARWEDRTERTPIPFGAVDLREVYTSPLSSWSVALARGDGSADAELATALQSEADLWSRFAAVQELADAGDFEAALDAVPAINEATASAPVWVQGWVQRGMYLKAYEVLADLRIPVGDEAFRARYVRRLDTLNVREGRLGSVSDPTEGAIVLVDRTRDFVVEDIWPLLRSEPAEDPFQQALRQTVERALGAEAFARLEASAAHRHTLVRTVREMQERGARCRTLRIAEPRWYGYTPESQERFAAMALEDRLKGSCQRVLREEAEALTSSFRGIVADEAVHTALKQLFAVAARGVLLHEARHAADSELVCEGCPDELSQDAVHEASAYLASLTDPTSAPLSWIQMCGVIRYGGSHGAAAIAVSRSIAPEGCASVPEDLQSRAAEVDAAWFGERASPSIPAEAPNELDLF